MNDQQMDHMAKVEKRMARSEYSKDDRECHFTLKYRMIANKIDPYTVKIDRYTIRGWCFTFSTR